MEIISILTAISTTIIAGYLKTVESRLRDMQKKQEYYMKRDEIKDILKLELKAVDIKSTNLKEDLDRIEHKLDYLVEKIVHLNHEK